MINDDNLARSEKHRMNAGAGRQGFGFGHVINGFLGVCQLVCFGEC